MEGVFRGLDVENGEMRDIVGPACIAANVAQSRRL